MLELWYSHCTQTSRFVHNCGKTKHYRFLTSVWSTASDQDDLCLAFLRKTDGGVANGANVAAQKGFAGLEGGRSSEREHGDGNGRKLHYEDLEQAEDWIS